MLKNYKTNFKISFTYQMYIIIFIMNENVTDRLWFDSFSKTLNLPMNAIEGFHVTSQQPNFVQVTLFTAAVF